jgi:diguanylate cyclase (GGDEF)-like protein
MRPDAATWQNTRDMVALDFAPRHLITRKILHGIIRMVFLQGTLATMVWAGVYSARSLHLERPGVPGFLARLGSGIAWLQDSHPWVAIVAAHVIAGLAVALVIRLRIWPPLRRHTKALQELLEAIRRMASGAQPKPLAVSSPSEASYLSLAFNDMASKLLASRQALVEANQLLEKRVDERTRELREAMERMHAMATTDALTGLANRRSLEHEVRQEFDISRRQQTELFCLLIDLDAFKLVNDTLGHKTGDELIRLSADILRKNAQAGDVAVRLGGDEFLLVTARGDVTQVVALADRLRQEFQRRAAEVLGGTTLPRMPSMSIGVSSRKATAAATIEELLSQADQALYRAKELGKARTTVYERRAA